VDVDTWTSRLRCALSVAGLNERPVVSAQLNGRAAQAHATTVQRQRGMRSMHLSQRHSRQYSIFLSLHSALRDYGRPRQISCKRHQVREHLTRVDNELASLITRSQSPIHPKCLVLIPLTAPVVGTIHACNEIIAHDETAPSTRISPYGAQRHLIPTLFGFVRNKK
jgi:hypothetical protein